MAALIQGTAAGIMKKAIEELHPELPRNAHLVLVVHDEVLIECPIPIAESVMGTAVKVMENAWPLDPPLSVDAKIVTTNYADAK
jgi:DNA polymerase-1